MNQRIFIDTNIILDLFRRREPFYNPAASLFSEIEKGLIEAFASSLTYANLHYILRKEFGSPKAVEVLKNLRRIVAILPVDDTVIAQALDSGFNDFEDAIQYYTARASNIPCLVTRNQKHFRAAAINICTAEEFLANYSS